MGAIISAVSTDFNPAAQSRVSTERLKAKFQKDLEDLEIKIDTWIKIAHNHGVDVSEEQAQLDWLDRDDRRTRSTTAEELALRRVHIVRSRLASILVRKVTSNFQREVDVAKINQIKEELKDFNRRLCTPWIRVAQREQVDISEEYQVIFKAIISEMELLEIVNPFQQEVIFRRQLITRQISTSRIIQKVYRHRIDRLAEEIKSKDWYDDERQHVVEGIRLEAQHSLPAAMDVERLIAACQKIYGVYQLNLLLFDRMPEVYHSLADCEVFSRSIDDRAHRLIKKSGSNDFMRQEAEQVRQLSQHLLRVEGYSENLRRRVNECFDMIEERIHW